MPFMRPSELRATPFSCFLLGEGSLLQQAARILLDRNVEVLGAMTGDPDTERGLEAMGIRVHPRGPVAAAAMTEAPFDYLFSIVNLALLPDDVLALPRRGAVNFHDGPLPGYAGLNTPSWALLNGETEHGVTWHEMTRGADRGRVLVERRFPLAPDDTALTVNARCFEAGIESFRELLDGLVHGTLEPREQDFSRRRLFTRIERPEGGGLIPFQASAREAAAFVAAHDFGRGFPNPFGLPRILVRDTVIHVGRAEVVPAEGGAHPQGNGGPPAFPPGTVTEVLHGGPQGGAGATPGAPPPPEAHPDAVLRVATADGIVALGDLRGPLGEPLDAHRLSGLGVVRGADVGSGPRDALTALATEALLAEPAWLAILRSLAPLGLPDAFRAPPPPAAGPDGSGAMALPAEPATLVLPLPPQPASSPGANAATSGSAGLGAFLAFLARLQGVEAFSLGFHQAPARERGRAVASEGEASETDPPDAHLDRPHPTDLAPFRFSRVPFQVDAPAARPAGEVVRDLQSRLESAASPYAPPLTPDLFLRYPDLEGVPRDAEGPRLPIVIRPGSTPAGPVPAAGPLLPGVELEITPDPAAGVLHLRLDPARFDPALADGFLRQATAFLAAWAALSPDDPTPLGALPLADAHQRREALEVGRGVVRPLDGGATVHALVATQAGRTPHAPAVTDRHRTLTYRELDQAASALASRLIRAGVEPGSRVGVFLDRSTDLLVATLGIMKAGAAYVPLDPAYPVERIRFMVEDAELSALVTQPALRHRAPPTEAAVVEVDGAAGRDPADPPGAPDAHLPRVDASSLAYVLYTSGSTGRPKGVLVEHRSVVNFFVQMDELLRPGADPG
ncbi:MAG: hypothetical protein EA350_00245, partial [Gemmatimonadales bacterium]